MGTFLGEKIVTVPFTLALLKVVDWCLFQRLTSFAVLCESRLSKFLVVSLLFYFL